MLQFEQEILEDIQWRNEQLLYAKTIPHVHSFTDYHKEFLIKYSIPIIYAIWEGFVQNCFQIYVRELNQNKLKKDDFCENIIFHTVDATFPELKQYPVEFQGRMKFTRKLNTFFEKEFLVSSIINTNSNVGLEVLNNILFRFNLKKVPEYPYKQNLKDLLGFRNRIAHGDVSLVINNDNIADFIKRIDDFVQTVNVLMDIIFQTISDGYKIDKSHLKVKI